MRSLGFARAAAILTAAFGLASSPAIIPSSTAPDVPFSFVPSKRKGHDWSGSGKRTTASRAKTIRRNRHQAKRKAAARRMRSL